MGFQVDIVSDVVCPWCYIGKRHLRGAMSRLQGPSVVRWHPMQLYPEVPREGVALDRFIRSRFGDKAAVEAAMAQLARSGRELGIDFNFDRIQVVPNTLDAHRLIGAAGASIQDPLVENLFKAFFEQGRDISDRDILLDIAKQSGMDPERALAALSDPATEKAVIAEQARLKKLGLNGIPNFLMNRRLSVSGARDTDTLLKAMDYALFGLPEEGSPERTLH